MYNYTVTTPLSKSPHLFTGGGFHTQVHTTPPSTHLYTGGLHEPTSPLPHVTPFFYGELHVLYIVQVSAFSGLVHTRKGLKKGSNRAERR